MKNEDIAARTSSLKQLSEIPSTSQIVKVLKLLFKVK